MKVFLLCNAHLDPVWQWDWDEGAAAALSTFRCAADFCEMFDGYVFNHNEALLYQYVEKNDPELFGRISTLIQAGKWIVVGGWYLQPDCNLPSGESVISQIEIGRKYFWEKFHVAPNVAMNIDSFGHSKGLVQILKKCGYKGYLFMRPMFEEISLPDNDFLWVGYDHSSVVAMRYPTWYCTSLGQSVARISELIDACPKEKNNLLVLWGMGDHGGGPSKKDIEEIDAFAKKVKDKGITVIHSNASEYLDTVDESKLPKYDKPLHHAFPGCYSSMSRVKRAHRELENELFITKSIGCIASANNGFAYPSEKIEQAKTDLCFSEFHDLLPGTSIADVEKSGLDIISRGRRTLAEIKAEAFFNLCINGKQAEPDTIPVFAYNPNPFELECEINCEFMLQNQNHDDEKVWVIEVYDENGEKLISQQEKERSNINMDWRKNVAFSAKLAPMGITRFDCKLTLVPISYGTFGWRGLPTKYSLDGVKENLVFKNGSRSVTVSENGLVSSWILDGKEMISNPLSRFVLYADSPDPWGMEPEKFDFKGEPKGIFRLATAEETAEICGFDHALPPVRIVEDGELRTIIESVWCYGRSYIVAKTVVPHHLKYVDMEYNVFMAEKDTMLKAVFEPKLSGEKTFFADDMFGNRPISEIGVEQPIQRWMALADDDSYFAVINKGQYAADYLNDAVRLTLLRTPAYTAHPTDGGVPTISQTRYAARMDQGEHIISVRMAADKKENFYKLSNQASAYNHSPYVMSVFPKGNDPIQAKSIRVFDECVELTNFEKRENGYLFRLFNPTPDSRSFTVECFGTKEQIALSPYAFDTFVYLDGVIKNTDVFGKEK